jgi:hypothetical protein
MPASLITCAGTGLDDDGFSESARQPLADNARDRSRIEH